MVVHRSEVGLDDPIWRGDQQETLGGQHPFQEGEAMLGQTTTMILVDHLQCHGPVTNIEVDGEDNLFSGAVESQLDGTGDGPYQFPTIVAMMHMEGIMEHHHTRMEVPPHWELEISIK